MHVTLTIRSEPSLQRANHREREMALLHEGSVLKNVLNTADVVRDAEGANGACRLVFGRKGCRRDLASAYMWYLICERNILKIKDAINAEKRKVAELLTAGKILEAQELHQNATKNLRSPKKSPLPPQASVVL